MPFEESKSCLDGVYDSHTRFSYALIVITINVINGKILTLGMIGKNLRCDFSLFSRDCYRRVVLIILVGRTWSTLQFLE